MAKHFTEIRLPAAANARCSARQSETWTATMVKRIHDRLYGGGLYTGDLFDDG